MIVTKLTVVSCGDWVAVYDGNGDRLFEVVSHTAPARAAAKPVWNTLWNLGFDVTHHNIAAKAGVGDFPLKWE